MGLEDEQRAPGQGSAPDAGGHPGPAAGAGLGVGATLGAGTAPDDEPAEDDSPAPEPDDEPAEDDDPTEDDGPEREWWDDPSMPWRHKPASADLACMAWIGLISLYGLAMIPLRGWLMGRSVPVLTALTGSRSAVAGLGALVRVGEAPWWWALALLAGLVMSVKFDWVYWWAGRLWGRGMIEVWAGQSPRAARTYARAERWALKWGAFGMFVAYVPIPLPVMAVVFVLAGASTMPVKKFVALDLASCSVWMAGYFLLGYAIGEPAVAVLKAYAKVANYVAIGLVIAVIATYALNARRKARLAA